MLSSLRLAHQSDGQILHVGNGYILHAGMLQRLKMKVRLAEYHCRHAFPIACCGRTLGTAVSCQPRASLQQKILRVEWRVPLSEGDLQFRKPSGSSSARPVGGSSLNSIDYGRPLCGKIFKRGYTGFVPVPAFHERPLLGSVITKYYYC